MASGETEPARPKSHTRKEGSVAARPFGRDEVIEAILDAAEHELLKHGPAVTTTRDIAQRANVNQALIFRYFGNKANLVNAVQLRHTQRFWDRIATLDVPLDQLFIEFAADEDFWRLMARTALDNGIAVPEPGVRIPGIDLLLDRVQEAQDDGIITKKLSPERILFLQFALVLGLVVLDPALASVFSLPGSGRAHSEEMLKAWFLVAQP